MSTCLKCGSFTESPSGTCASCESSGSSLGTPAGVPCQRCGMYLPSHELKMWNSRLYCSYCIMDVQDEENRMRKHTEAKRHEEAASGSGGAGQQSGSAQGVCDKCGRQAETLYSLGGQRLCGPCYSESGGSAGGSAPSVFGQFVQQLRKLIRKPQPPKIIAAQPLEKQQAPGTGFRKVEGAQQSSERQNPKSEEKGARLEKNEGGQQTRDASERRFVLRLKKDGDEKK